MIEKKIYVMGRNITEDGSEFVIQGVFEDFVLALTNLQNNYWLVELPINKLLPFEIQEHSRGWWKIQDKIYLSDDKGNILEELS